MRLSPPLRLTVLMYGLGTPRCGAQAARSSLREGQGETPLQAGAGLPSACSRTLAGRPSPPCSVPLTCAWAQHPGQPGHWRAGEGRGRALLPSAPSLGACLRLAPSGAAGPCTLPLCSAPRPLWLPPRSPLSWPGADSRAPAPWGPAPPPRNFPISCQHLSKQPLY